VKVSVLSTPKIWESIRENHPAQIKDLAKYQPKHGTLIETLTANRAKDITKINQAITQGLLKGDSYSTMARNIKDIMNGSANQAVRIARTEGIRNMNAGALANTEDAMNAGVDVGREVVEVMDSRTRDQSLDINGDRYPGIEPFLYPDGLLVNSIGNSGVAKYDINERGGSVDYVEGIEPNTVEGVNPVTGDPGNTDMRQFNAWMRENDLVYTDTGRITSRGRTAFGDKPIIPQAIKPKHKVDFGYPNGQFNELVADIRPEAKAIVNKYPKPNSIKIDDNSMYNFRTRDLLTSDNVRVFNHEYGHHLDISVPNSNNKLSTTPEFKKAYRLDKNNYEDMDVFKVMDKTIEIGYNAETGQGSAISDIMDSFKNGELYDRFGRAGHGSDYYSHLNASETESFANLYQIWATGEKWELIKETLPNLTKEFEKTIGGL